MSSPFSILEKIDRWSPELEPQPNEGRRSEKTEPLHEYLDRVRPIIGHLPDAVIEQWIYRHFSHTRYRNIPLGNLKAALECWPAEQILSIGSIRHTKTDLADEIDNHKFFNQWKNEPARTIRETGTWDFPILILEHGQGFLDQDRNQLPFVYWLIEGHSRFRFFNYWNAQGNANQQHDVWVIRGL